MACRRNIKGRQMSTPIAKLSTSDQMPPQLDHNASRILGYSVFRRSHTVNAPDASRMLNAGAPASASVATAASENPRVLRAKYLRATFVNAKAKEMMQKERKQMTDYLDSLVAIQESLIKKVTDLLLKEDAAKNKVAVQESLDSQLNSGLVDVCSQLSATVEPCGAIDAALTATMQSLRVDNVVLPDAQEWSPLLDKMRQIASAITTDGQFVEAVAEEGRIVTQLSEVVSNETDDLHRMTQEMDELSQSVAKGSCLRMYKN